MAFPLLLPYGVCLFNKNICRIMLGWVIWFNAKCFSWGAAYFWGRRRVILWAPSPEQLLLILIVGSEKRCLLFPNCLDYSEVIPRCAVANAVGSVRFGGCPVAISKMAELSPLDEATLMLGSIGLATASLVVSVPEVFRFVRRELKISKVFV